MRVKSTRKVQQQQKKMCMQLLELRTLLSRTSVLHRQLRFSCQEAEEVQLVNEREVCREDSDPCLLLSFPFFPFRWLTFFMWTFWLTRNQGKGGREMREHESQAESRE